MNQKIRTKGQIYLDLGFCILVLYLVFIWFLDLVFWNFRVGISPRLAAQRYAVQGCDATKAPASGPGLGS